MKRLIALATVVVVAALVFAVWPRASTTPSASFAWPRGQRYVYSLTWNATTHLAGDATAGLPPTEGVVDLTGELELQSLGARGDTTLLALSMPTLERHHWTVLGRDLFPDDASVRATFAGRTAYISARSDDGSFAGIKFTPDAPPLFRAAMSAIAPQVLVTLRSGTEWEALEQGPSGRARVRYERTDNTLERTRIAYRTIDALPDGMCTDCRPTLDSTASIAIAGGHVEALDDHETLLSRRPDGSSVLDVRAHFAIELTSVTAVVDTAVDETQLVEATPIADLQREALERRTEGLTGDALIDQLRISALTGKLGIGTNYPIRAVALLQLHPELCDQLRDLFEDQDMNQVSRGMILDLLTSAGSGPAQEAMRSILDSDSARTDPHGYVTFVERFAIVEKPAPESAPFIDHLRAEAASSGDHNLELAALYTLGSMAGHLATSGDLTTARTYTARLRTELHTAASPDDKRALLAALGNADLPDDTAAIAELAHDVSPDVRAQVAVSLRDATTPTALAALETLATDSDANVAKTAWATLEHRSIPNDELVRLTTSVRDGRVPAGAEAEVASLLAEHRDNRTATDALAALYERTDDYALKARLDELLHPSR